MLKETVCREKISGQMTYREKTVSTSKIKCEYGKENYMYISYLRSDYVPS